MNPIKRYLPSLLLVAGCSLAPAQTTPPEELAMDSWPEPIQRVLDTCKPLDQPFAGRLPLYLWPAMDPGPLDDARAEELVRLLNDRGIGLVASWQPGQVDQLEESALPIARAQRKLGLRININANACTYSFFNGDPATAHVEEAANPFFDESFGPQKMGCPVTLDSRRAAIRDQIAPFARRYADEGLPLGFVWADWEIDGPIEWNDAWENSKRCTRCRQAIPDIENFLSFQHALRELRSNLQYDCYSRPILELHPAALVGNYAVYPNDGFRYWYDYFETEKDSWPGLREQGALYRHWSNEFAGTGYTFAMPVVYTWYRTFDWYDFDDPDYRWFYNMLKVASNAARHTPASMPIISFVHWHTTAPPDAPDPAVLQMSDSAYQELLWHMLLRGHDTFFLWCMPDEQAKEMELLHPVWAAAQAYREFLDKGTPINFEIPESPGTVVSGLRLGDRVLVRHSAFGPAAGESWDNMQIMVDGRRLTIPFSPGACQVLTLQ